MSKQSKQISAGRKKGLKKAKLLNCPPNSVVETRHHGEHSNKKVLLEDSRCFEYRPGKIEALEEILSTSTKPVTFLYQRTATVAEDFVEHENNIVIAPVAVLQKTKRREYGVYAKADFKKNHSGAFCLGEYLGEQSLIDENNPNVLYTWQVGERYEINAQSKRSWLAMMNAASCEDAANVEAKRTGQKVFYHLKRTVHQGEQFLVYYGDRYQFPNKRFLNPSDTWEDSSEKYLKYSAYYKSMTLDGKECRVPDITQVNSETVNLPILFKNKAGDFVAQYAQDNRTLLHLACERADIDEIKYLLSLGAYPNQQTSIRGVSPLHAALLGRGSIDQKKEIIDLFMNHPVASLMLQDSDDRSILHIAILQKELELITQLLTFAHKRRNSSYRLSIKHCIDDRGYDYLLSALATGDLEVLEAIRPFVLKQDIIDILSKEEEALCASDEVPCDNFRDLVKTLKTTYSKEKFDAIKAMLLSFTSDTGLQERINEVMSENFSSEMEIVLDEPFYQEDELEMTSAVEALLGLKSDSLSEMEMIVDKSSHQEDELEMTSAVDALLGLKSKPISAFPDGLSFFSSSRKSLSSRDIQACVHKYAPLQGYSDDMIRQWIQSFKYDTNGKLQSTLPWTPEGYIELVCIMHKNSEQFFRIMNEIDPNFSKNLTVLLQESEFDSFLYSLTSAQETLSVRERVEACVEKFAPLEGYSDDVIRQWVQSFSYDTNGKLRSTLPWTPELCIKSVCMMFKNSEQFSRITQESKPYFLKSLIGLLHTECENRSLLSSSVGGVHP